jgi:hypothetical protein
VVGDLLDIDLLDDEEPFEIDSQAAHLFKHAALGLDDIYDVWRSARFSIRQGSRLTGS